VNVFLSGSHITQKRHLLTKHAAAQMRFFGCMGDKIKTVVERLHQSSNTSGSILAELNDWHKIKESGQRRKGLGKNLKVVAVLNKTQNIPGNDTEEHRSYGHRTAKQGPNRRQKVRLSLWYSFQITADKTTYFKLNCCI
jgi:hypothetical protein